MLVEILIVLLTLLGFAAYKIHRARQHWKNLGVPEAPYNDILFGSMPFVSLDIMFKRKSITETAKEQYHHPDIKDHPVYGVYLFGLPYLWIRDPELVKTMLVKDFHHFADRIGPQQRQMVSNNTWTDRLWNRQLIGLPANEWKDVRSTFSPIFSSGKMRAMVQFIHATSKSLADSLADNAETGKEFELKEKCGNFSMDTIASCAFGVDVQSFKNPDSPFVKHAKSVFKRNFSEFVKFMVLFMPGGSKLMNALNISIQKPDEAAFFYEVIMGTLEYRKKTKTRRNDLVDMMVEAMASANNDEAEQEEDDTDQYAKDAQMSHKVNKKNLDEYTIVATAMVMLVAGYDTTAQTLSYCLFELARNPDIQKRLQDEIDDALEDSDGKMPDMATVQSLEYLDMVFQETLRRWPALGFLQRAVTGGPYKVPGTDITLTEGQEIVFNTVGMHSDPKYYPNPEKFDPERFSKENKAKRHP